MTRGDEGQSFVALHTCGGMTDAVIFEPEHPERAGNAVAGWRRRKEPPHEIKMVADDFVRKVGEFCKCRQKAKKQ